MIRTVPAGCDVDPQPVLLFVKENLAQVTSDAVK
jgi:hypothetical protein